MARVGSGRLSDQRCKLFAEIHAGSSGIAAKLAERIGQELGDKKLTIRVEAGLRGAWGIVSVGGGSRWKVEALLPDHWGSVAGWGVERGHWRVEKSRRDSKERDIRIFEGNRRCRLGGEMGGRGVDSLLEKVFNPARDWVRGRRTPDSASRPKHTISGVLIKKSRVVN